jgi:CMP-N-acetylneuraminic acid synthetase
VFSDEYDSSMSILVVIPARSGSMGLPGKNFMLLHGKPLYMWAVDLALEINGDVKICVSTDLESLLESKVSNQITYLRRPKNLSGAKVIDQPVLLHALKYYTRLGVEFDAVVMLQPTAPGRTLAEVNDCINAILVSSASACWTVSPVPTKYNWLKQFQLDEMNCLANVVPQTTPKRRQDLKQTFIRNGNCYAMSVKTINDDPFLLGREPKSLISTDSMINIDDEQDFIEAQLLLESKDGIFLSRVRGDS